MNWLIPFSVISEAMSGNDVAVSAVITHYRGYIRFLSRRSLKGTVVVDEDMQHRLECKLIYAVVTNFKILEED